MNENGACRGKKSQTMYVGCLEWGTVVLVSNLDTFKWIIFERFYGFLA